MSLLRGAFLKTICLKMTLNFGPMRLLWFPCVTNRAHERDRTNRLFGRQVSLNLHRCHIDICAYGYVDVVLVNNVGGFLSRTRYAMEYGLMIGPFVYGAVLREVDQIL